MSEFEAELATMAADVIERGGPPARPGLARPRELDRGDLVGRYVVLERLGVGGMGEVYAAYDPELDRKIAIKLLLPERAGSKASSSGHARLQREAQAMAKLAHPNVVVVHDVGSLDERVFVAMEFVDGGTLDDWIEDGCDGAGKPHPWPEVLARFLAAGEGLAAAHAAGLIHRDFKPANVLLGRDGSVRVADFGLARAAVVDDGEPSASEPGPVAELEPAVERDGERPESDEETLPAVDRTLGEGRSIKSLSIRMTATGATLGTPAYMAPEQYTGTQVDARADQFSFCVALWEALYGERPYAGDSLHVLMFAIAQAKLREPPAGAEVPAALRRALQRGLAHDPRQRWPSMRALLTELRRDPAARRRNALIGILGLGLVGALAWAVVASRPEPVVEEPVCTGAAAALGDALSPARREAIAERFAALEQGWARDVGERLLPRLDAWTQDWLAAWTDACEDTHVRAEQSPELLDRRLTCLDRQRRGFVKLVDGLAEADDALAKRADTLLDELGSIAACSDSEELLRITPMPADPRRAAAIAEVDETLSDAHGLFVGGRVNDARALLEAVAARVEELDYAPLSASYEQLRGRIDLDLADAVGGEQALERAFTLALEAGDDRRACMVARSLGIDLRDTDRLADAARWAVIALALADRLDDDALRGAVQIAISQIRAAQGDYPGAERAAIAAYELLRRARPDQAVVGDALYLMALASHRAGRHDEAIERIERARAAWTTDVGPNHPRSVAALGLLGNMLRDRGDYATAEQHFRAALAIGVDSYGPDHIKATTYMINLAIVLGDQGKYDEAIELNERVIAIYEATPTAGAAWTGRNYANLASAQREGGRLDDALVSITRAEALLREALGPEHPDLAVLFHIRAELELDLGRLDAAERSVAAALKLSRSVYDADHPIVFETEILAARIALARGKPKLAEQRLIARPTAATNPGYLGQHELVRARIHEALGRRGEALAAAERARAAFERDGAGSARQLAELDDWVGTISGAPQ